MGYTGPKEGDRPSPCLPWWEPRIWTGHSSRAQPINTASARTSRGIATVFPPRMWWSWSDPADEDGSVSDGKGNSMNPMLVHFLLTVFLFLPFQACFQPAHSNDTPAESAPKARPTPTLNASTPEPPPTPAERFSARCRALKPLSVGGDVLSPRKREAPPWTLEASETQKISGRLLVLDAVLDADGNVCDAILVGSLDPDVDGKLVGWAKKLKYDPATRDGKPVACLFRIKILLDV